MALSNLPADWQEFEKFVAGLYREEDDVEVVHNIKLQDKEGVQRQIDVAVRFRRGAHKFLIVIEAKCWNKRVERGQIDQLCQTVQKVNASKGVVFTTVGFQDGAIKTASANGIDLLLVKQPEADEWWPPSKQHAQLQVCSFALQNGLTVPPDAVEVGTAGEWPRGIQLHPDITFRPTRSKTRVLSFVERVVLLEDLIENHAQTVLPTLVSPIGPIGDGGDCVGHFTADLDLIFRPKIVVKERDEPFVVLRIEKAKARMVVRIEQRALIGRSPNELAFCALAHNVVTGEVFQVGRAESEQFPSWVAVSSLPLGLQVPHDHRIVTVVSESFRPELFDNPWTTYGRVTISGVEQIPESRAVTRILKVLGRPAPSPTQSETTDSGDKSPPAAKKAAAKKAASKKAASKKAAPKKAAPKKARSKKAASKKATSKKAAPKKASKKARAKKAAAKKAAPKKGATKAVLSKAAAGRKRRRKRPPSVAT